MKYTIIVGNSAKVPIPDSSQALAVTSPPYGAAKDYQRDDVNNIGNYVKGEYFKRIEPVHREVFRVLMPGRKYIVNITDLPDEAKTDKRFSYFKYGLKTVELLEEIGFELEETVIWTKGRNRSGGAPGTLPDPPSPMLLNNWEYCFIMRKPGDTVALPTDEQKKESRMSKDFIADVLYTTWDIRPETAIEYHIAPYPVELPERFIKLYTFVGESVYDPFLGSGTTLVACKNTHRSGVGCELGYKTPDNKSWLEHIKERVGWDETSVKYQLEYEIIDSNGNPIESVPLLKREKETPVLEWKDKAGWKKQHTIF